MDTKSLSNSRKEIGFPRWLFPLGTPIPRSIEERDGYPVAGISRNQFGTTTTTALGNFRAGDNVPLGYDRSIFFVVVESLTERATGGVGNTEGSKGALAGILSSKPKLSRACTLQLATSLCANWVTGFETWIPPPLSREEKGRMRWNMAQTKWIVKVARPPFSPTTTIFNVLGNLIRRYSLRVMGKIGLFFDLRKGIFQGIPAIFYTFLHATEWRLGRVSSLTDVLEITEDEISGGWY